MIPPWQRNEDCTHLAVVLTKAGGGQIEVNTTSVRGDTVEDGAAVGLEVAHAMGAADYTIRGMEGEIADYLRVVGKMKAKMDSMSDEVRHEIEEASKVLRRLRAGSATSGPVPLPMPMVRPADEAGA
jgi:hypothetical protein